MIYLEWAFPNSTGTHIASYKVTGDTLSMKMQVFSIICKAGRSGLECVGISSLTEYNRRKKIK